MARPPSVLPYFLASFTWNYGLGWGISHFTTPLVMGLLADRYGIVSGFYVLGVLALATVVFIAFLRQWAFARTKLGKCVAA